MSARCNKCGKVFKMKPKLHKYPNGVYKSYIECSRCKNIFIVFYTDQEIRKLQARQLRLSRKWDTLTVAQIEEYKAIEKLLIDKMGKLHDKYENNNTGKPV